MTLGIMQPYLFPYIGYWQLINSVDTFVIYDDVNFIKQGYINRNYILVDKKKKLFTLEVIGASSNALINEVVIGNNINKLLKTIRQNYAKAPYFKVSFPIIEKILLHKEKNIAKFIGHSLQELSALLEIETQFIYSSTLQKNVHLKADGKIVNICNILQANHYINAIGGKVLYHQDDFGEILLSFIETDSLSYQQFNNEFVPNLSIIDILMFNNLQEIKNMLKRYHLR